MLIVVLALIVLAATAAVVIHDAHPSVPRPVADVPDQTPEPEPQPEAPDQPTEAIDMTEFVWGLPGPDPSFDPPTQSMAMPMAFSGAQAAAILPYPTVEPAAFVPAGRPHLQPDPERLIQTEVVINDVQRAQRVALTRLVIGLAASGAIVGLGVVGLGRIVVLIFRG